MNTLNRSSAVITSTGDRFRACIFSRFRYASTVRIFPPYTTGAFAPRDDITIIRTW